MGQLQPKKWWPGKVGSSCPPLLFSSEQDPLTMVVVGKETIVLSPWSSIETSRCFALRGFKN